jgi:hypothetical protein
VLINNPDGGKISQKLVAIVRNLDKTRRGEGFIAGVDNGNQISHEPFKARQRKAFHGMALAIVQAKERPGRIVLRASSLPLCAFAGERSAVILCLFVVARLR